MNLLLHICCAPCAIYPVEMLRQEGHHVQALFYNPNIHPYLEHERRRQSAIALRKLMGLELIARPEYDMEEFFRLVVPRLEERCRLCYEMRLRKTARLTREMGFDAFSTTLFSSPYQNLQTVIEAGSKCADEEEVNFYIRNFRDGFRQSQSKARELSLYRQQYCGCIFSEKERYLGGSDPQGPSLGETSFPQAP